MSYPHGNIKYCRAEECGGVGSRVPHAAFTTPAVPHDLTVAALMDMRKLYRNRYGVEPVGVCAGSGNRDALAEIRVSTYAVRDTFSQWVECPALADQWFVYGPEGLVYGPGA